ncbi:MAG: hypothetical protein AAGI48_12275 [Verrucomicrobiota bacterium]
MNKLRAISLSLVAACLATAAPVHAGNSSPSVFETLPASEPPKKSWEFGFQMYGWASDIGGHADIAGTRQEIDFPISDILDHLDMTVMVTALAKKDRFTFLADYIYLKMSGDQFLSGPLFGYKKTALRMHLLNLIGTYRIWENHCAFIELGGGARYLGNEVEVHLNSGIAAPRYLRIKTDSWNAVGAIRAGYDFNEKWGIRGYFDIGGGDADITWLANLALHYKIRENTSLVLGYRYLFFDISQGTNGIELDVSGPYLGAAFNF